MRINKRQHYFTFNLMGNEQSSEETQPVQIIKPVDQETVETIEQKQHQQIHIEQDTKVEDFFKYRNSNTIDDALKCMDMLGTCVNKIEPSAVEPYVKDGIKIKVLFVIVNTYEKPNYKLGVGPLNDSITVALNHVKMGYRMVYLHNSTTTHFLKWLKFILKKTQSDLTIFYTGHGSYVRDRSGDESDGYDEVMLFDNGYIIDDELANYLCRYAHGQRIVLLSDCCHSGSMWDIQSMIQGKSCNIKPNIISISAAKDSQTAKQTKIKSKDQGIFTFYFWQIWEQKVKISAKDMERKINPSISRFSQHFTFASTTENLPNEPIFPHDIEAKYVAN